MHAATYGSLCRLCDALRAYRYLWTGLDRNRGEGVWEVEVKDSVHEDDTQAMMRENKISEEAAVDNDSEGKGKGK
jgi:hypothetical protein